LVFVDRQETLSHSDLEDDDIKALSFQTNLPLDCVQAKLEVIDSNRSAATDAFSFILELSKALQQPQGEWYNAQDLSRYLTQREVLASTSYANLSSPGDGESLALIRIANPTNVIPFTFDITVTTFSDESELSKQLYDWCLSSPSAVRAMSLSTHRSAKGIGEKELTNILTLRGEAVDSDSTMSSLAQWSKQAPDRLLVSPGLPFYARNPATSLTKSHRVSNDLTTWVEQRNQSSVLTAASSTRQGNYRRVLVLPIRWEKCDFNADGEIGFLRSVLQDHFNFTIEADLVLPSNNDAQNQLDRRFKEYLQPGSTKTLASQDLFVVIYNGHGADGFYENSNMIFA
jgi:hypothetical protein